MTVAAFPSTVRAPSYGWEEEWDRNVIESPFEDGSVQLRSKYPRGRDSYTLTWNSIPQAELDILETFYKTTISRGALPFTITRPATVGGSAKTVTVMLLAATKPKWLNRDNWTISLSLKEV